ncbi:fibronectin type III domain-containing protein [uncultured Psychromonas sp.]|uniref:fibronectin type III domain-containing protein n=1 Tax=uncultured Psychromonas sp. TaxID=173974 RepID=UPI00260E06FF|nr:fibronectin type III domain-containing protein [uncultured Psychromonas sp.]
MSVCFVSLLGCADDSSNSVQSNKTYNDSSNESTSESTEIFDVLEEYESLEVRWDDLADNEEGFLIERSLGGADEFVILTSVNANQVSYIDTNVLSNNTYCYRIGAYNNSGIAYSDISCNDDR